MSGALSRRFRRFLEQNSLLREYLWKYRKLVSLGLLTLIFVDLLEIIPPLLLKRAVDEASATQDLSITKAAVLELALIYLGITFAQALGRYGWRMFLIRSSMFSGRDIRNRFARHLFHLSASFFDKRRIGDLMSLNTSDVEAVRMAMGPGLLTLADAAFYFLTVPVAMYLLSPELTLLAFIPLPLIPFIVLKNEKKIHQRFQQMQESFSHISAMAQEGLNGVRVIKAFAREDAQIDRIRKAGERHIELSLRLARVQSAFGPTLDFAMSLGIVILLYFGGKYVITDVVSLGTFVAFQRYIQKMIWPMTAIGLSISFYQRAVASSDRLKEILAVNTDTPEPLKPLVPAGYTGRVKGRVELDRLSFQFPGTHTPVLRDIRLTIEPGERVAFVGAIGAGKSALLSLLPRLYPVERGMLRIDGVDVNDWSLEELRRQVGYVSQEVFLFSESVLENVALGLNQPIDRWTRLASVHEDIEQLGQGYQTLLGERGVNLSGGQKQRLTIARALAKQPPILVLDDALSSVDVRTEESILSSLRARDNRNTELIAAHRISTIDDADRIVVLEAGTISQQGTHATLLKQRSGLYRRYYDQQQMREDLERYTHELGQTEVPTS